ncbi:MAG: hypothetical protein IPK83_25145 [Planctomycetes bacterium]|nr:hypothetical protein [Planctomycetota bacterium]
MKMTPTKLLLIVSTLSVVFASFTGCSLTHLQTSDRLDRGLVIVLPGIEGRSIWNVDLAQGLNDGRVDCAIEIYDWGTSIPGGFLINLAHHDRNLTMADALSRYIVNYKTDHPGRQVHLIGHSGGAGLALMAVEKLPADMSVESITLLAVAISPEFDLRPALRNTSGNIYNCYSQNDSILLGAGTSLAGTIDRKYGESAGKVGFRVRANADPQTAALYRKLRQREWKPELARLGNDGGHFG